MSKKGSDLLEQQQKVIEAEYKVKEEKQEIEKENLPAKVEDKEARSAAIYRDTTLPGTDVTYLQWNQMKNVARTIFDAGVLNNTFKKSETVAWGMLKLYELGMPIVSGLDDSMIINNRFSLWGDAILSLCRSRGVLEYYKEGLTNPDEQDVTKMIAFAEGKRKGEPDAHRETFSWNDAIRAELVGKDTYKKYPKRMLVARARAYCLRFLCADILKGCAITEVAQEEERPAQVSVIPSEVQELKDKMKEIGNDQN